MWYMEVKVAGLDGKKSWQKVGPAVGPPYKFNTEYEARRMLDVCYPTQESRAEVRVTRDTGVDYIKERSYCQKCQED